eukprot:8061228-Pyramimonas_sp.AAC.1
MAQHLSSTGGAAEEAGGGPHVLPVHQQPPQDHHLPRLAQVLQVSVSKLNLLLSKSCVRIVPVTIGGQ